jgi:hypothetical protein
LVALCLSLVCCIVDHPEGPSSLGNKDEQQGRFAVGSFFEKNIHANAEQSFNTVVGKK